MANTFTARVLARTRSSRNSTRAVEKSPLVEFALVMTGLLER
jgi:hypothetical protein